MSEPTDHSADGRTDADRLLVERPDRRRLTLDVLAGLETSVQLDELAAGVAVRELGFDDADSTAIDCIAVDLHHVHLPALADVSALEYDPSSKRIDPSGLGTNVASVFETRRSAAGERQRTVLASLPDGREISVERLSRRIAEETAGATDAHTDTVACTLHHCDLPALADAGRVRYDPEDRTVEPA
ncbi:DUF7344 domain-containing protein [Halomicrobium urmianum]|uniref:DUF7344 domain-containing protein n=1 Tax=Halomicrobium urmianum TaxID=1586233 RepID=UPI001CD9BD68|nr:hypothetical protein [Halomicrobium urmianum]